MPEKKTNKKLQQILLDLGSKDDKKIAKAIKAMEAHGDASVIRPLATALLTDLSEKNRSAILELLSSLKDTSAAVEIMEVVGDEKYITIRPEILTTIWNTKVDFSNYIDEFVEIAVNGSMMEALDCLTIIENLEGPFMEEDILECQLHLKNYLEDDSPKDEQKAHLLSEIAIIIKDVDRKLVD